MQLTKCALIESTISRESHLSSDDVMHASMYHKHPKRSAGPSELSVHWDQLPPSDFGRSKTKPPPSSGVILMFIHSEKAIKFCKISTLRPV